VSAAVPASLHDRLIEVAREHDVSVSAVVRAVIRKALRQLAAKDTA
jgi:post-segregation antitoxin (ccd killing protein)